MKKIFILLAIYSFLGCNKKLDLKPNSNIILPKSLRDLELMLENTDVMNFTPALAQMSADEYIIPNLEGWESLEKTTSKNSSLWKKNIYEGETHIRDWEVPYTAIFYCNNVLNILASENLNNDIEKKRLKGWALFSRAYAFYSLVSIFSNSYGENSYSDMGVPLKLNPGIDEIVQRSSVQQTYDQILSDALEASELLQQNIIEGKINQPSKVAAYAFLARVYLSMRKYDKAEEYAEKTLSIYSKLTDYNTLSKTDFAWSYYGEEVIYFSCQINEYYDLTNAWLSPNYSIDPRLLALYDPSDLRLDIYFDKNPDGYYNIKRINTFYSNPFTGLATDEIYLIKAECLARRGEILLSMNFLNTLVSKRWNPNFTETYIPYKDIIASTPEDALNKILLERRKSLVWRSLRWTDLKRLNLEGRNIILTRKLDNTTYTLEPNSPRYIMPIPDDEVMLSGIKQNVR